VSNRVSRGECLAARTLLFLLAMNSLTQLRVVELLDAFASNEPLPAGGSAAALTGAIGTSLLLMVATLPKTRPGSQTRRLCWPRLRSGCDRFVTS
jgi:hypothetical protein